MARTKQTAKYYGKPRMTWTRFHLPADQEWPTWPGPTNVVSQESYFGPLAGVEGVYLGFSFLGRMVEFPEEAVYLIAWRTVDDVHNFLKSPACDEFLRNLPEHEHDLHGNTHAAPEESDAEAEMESARQRMNFLALGEENTTSSPSTSAQTTTPTEASDRRRRFLILENLEGVPTADTEGRVTLSAFVVPVANRDDWSGFRKAYQVLRQTFGKSNDSLTPPNYEFIKQVGWTRDYWRVWFYGVRGGEGEEGGEDLSEEWMERTFGRRGRGDLGMGEGGNVEPGQSGGVGPKTLMCEFRVWNDEPRAKVNRHLEKEEAHAKDSVFRERWDRVVGEWTSRGEILAWKRERWDFWPMPELPFIDDSDEEDGEGEGMDMDG